MHSRGKELLLIGTVHRDPEGATKLGLLLARESPAVVAVEVSPYALYYRRRNGRQLQRRLRRTVNSLSQTLGVPWQRWGQLRAIQSQLMLPFEYRSAQKHCRDTGAALFCLDSSACSKYWINHYWPQLVSRENLAALLEQDPEDSREEVKKSYLLAARLLAHGRRQLLPALAQSWSEDPQWEERESELAKGVQSLFAELETGRLAYIGGWQHLLSPTRGLTLYERLSHLEPRRILLNGVI